MAGKDDVVGHDGLRGFGQKVEEPAGAEVDQGKGMRRVDPGGDRSYLLVSNSNWAKVGTLTAFEVTTTSNLLEPAGSLPVASGVRAST